MVIFKAKKIDSEDFVDGSYLYYPDRYDEDICAELEELHCIVSQDATSWNYKIEPKTLQLSLDNGESWNSIEEVKKVIETARWMEDIE